MKGEKKSGRDNKTGRRERERERENKKANKPKRKRKEKMKDNNKKKKGKRVKMRSAARAAVVEWRRPAARGRGRCTERRRQNVYGLRRRQVTRKTR